MAKTPSNMIPLNTSAPDFSLPDTITGQMYSIQDCRSDKATVVMFICNHCPFVLHILSALVEIIKLYQDKGIQFVAISSNDIEHYPQDAPDLMTTLAKEHGFTFPYLYDETQDIAKAYDAACTPDFFVFDKDLKCVYRGRFDGATPGNNIPVTGNDLKAALDAVLENRPVNSEQLPSLGCNIKWKLV